MWFLEDLTVYELCQWAVVQQLVFDSCCCVSWCHWLYNWLAQFTIAKPEVVYLLVVISHWTT